MKNQPLDDGRNGERRVKSQREIKSVYAALSPRTSARQFMENVRRMNEAGSSTTTVIKRPASTRSKSFRSPTELIYGTFRRKRDDGHTNLQLTTEEVKNHICILCGAKFLQTSLVEASESAMVNVVVANTANGSFAMKHPHCHAATKSKKGSATPYARLGSLKPVLNLTIALSAEHKDEEGKVVKQVSTNNCVVSLDAGEVAQLKADRRTNVEKDELVIHYRQTKREEMKLPKLAASEVELSFDIFESSGIFGKSNPVNHAQREKAMPVKSIVIPEDREKDSYLVTTKLYHFHGGVLETFCIVFKVNLIENTFVPMNMSLHLESKTLQATPLSQELHETLYALTKSDKL